MHLQEAFTRQKDNNRSFLAALTKCNDPLEQMQWPLLRMVQLYNQQTDGLFKADSNWNVHAESEGLNHGLHNLS